MLAAAALAQTAPLSLRTSRPGNLFAAGTQPAVTVQGPPGVCEWQVTDFGGGKAAGGSVQLGPQAAPVQLPALPVGYYEFRCSVGESRARLPFGVVVDHSQGPRTDTPLNVDTAAAWLCKPEQFEDQARMLRVMGLAWARERFSWGATEPEKDKVDWKQYDANAAAYSKAGVRVYQIFHDSPGWTHDGKDTRNPRDLRDVYRFTRRLAEHYRGKVEAWEIWNEPDIGFWPDLSDTYAGLVKAAYLGFKSADPGLPVLLGSSCRGVSAFDDGMLAAGLGDYYDIFNWHIYAPPGAYAPTLHGYLKLLSQYRQADRPVWLTEAGIRLVATEPDGELNAADERKQAEFVPRSLASSLAAGTDNHFFFVFPYYLENGVQFGVLHRDLSPRPACIALAAAADLLGRARYLGRYPVPDAPDAVVLAFDTGRGRALVAWADEPREVALPMDARSVTIANPLGTPASRETEDGVLRLTLGPVAQYVCGAGAKLLAGLSGPVRPPGRLPANDPCPVIVRGQLDGAPVDKGKDCYLVGDRAYRYVVEAYNFGAQAAAGKLSLSVPAGWLATPQEASVQLRPLGRATVRFTVTPGRPLDGALELKVVPSFAGLKVAPSVSRVRFDYASVPVAESKDLSLNEASKWHSGISGNGTMKVSQAGEAVRFDVHFTAAGDRWYYPYVTFDPPADFSQYQGVSFEYRCNAAAGNSTVRLQLYEAGGAGYLCAPLPSQTEWRTTAVRFAELEWGSFSPVDANGSFDPQAIKTLMIGGNTPGDSVWLEVRNVKLVKW